MCTLDFTWCETWYSVVGITWIALLLRVSRMSCEVVCYFCFVLWGSWWRVRLVVVLGELLGWVYVLCALAWALLGLNWGLLVGFVLWFPFNCWILCFVLLGFGIYILCVLITLWVLYCFDVGVTRCVVYADLVVVGLGMY